MSVRWVEADPAALRRQSLLANVVGGLLVAISIGMSLYILPLALASEAGRFTVLPLLGLVAVAMLANFRYLRLLVDVATRMRLGASRDGLHYRLPRWQGALRLREGFEPWSRVYYDGGRLLVGSILLVLEAPKYRVFDGKAVAGLLGAHLPPGNRLAASELTRRAFRAHAFHPVLAIVAAGLVAGLAVIYLTRP